MEFIKDIIKIVIGGLTENWAECKISDKRQEYFEHKGGTWAKICFYGSIIVIIGLVICGFMEIIRNKSVLGILLICAGGGIGMYMLAEWGTSKK